MNELSSRIKLFPAKSSSSYEGKSQNLTGIFAIKIKAKDVSKVHLQYINLKNIDVSPLLQGPDLKFHFWITDVDGYRFDIVEAEAWNKKNKNIIGGEIGAVIRVADMDKALAFYMSILGASKKIYDCYGEIDGLPGEEKNKKIYRNVLLVKEEPGKEFNNTQIELQQLINTSSQQNSSSFPFLEPDKMQLSLNVLNIDTIIKNLEKSGYAFALNDRIPGANENPEYKVCDLNDPDGTRIEIRQPQKNPTLKKLSSYFNLKKNIPPMPYSQVRLLGFK